MNPPTTLLPVPPGGVEFWHLLEALAGSDVTAAKSLSMSQWSRGVTCTTFSTGGSVSDWYINDMYTHNDQALDVSIIDMFMRVSSIQKSAYRS